GLVVASSGVKRLMASTSPVSATTVVNCFRACSLFITSIHAIFFDVKTMVQGGHCSQWLHDDLSFMKKDLRFIQSSHSVTSMEATKRKNGEKSEDDQTTLQTCAADRSNRTTDFCQPGTGPGKFIRHY